MTTQTILIIALVIGSVLYLSRGLWTRKKPGRKGCGDCSGCSCH